MSTLNEILPDLKGYRSILVTGPQRSGTTIAGHILAAELGYRYADENEVKIHDPNLAYFVLKEGRVVLQAPGLCHMAADLAAKLGHAVVLMRRPVDDIKRSEDRIHWREAYGGLNLLAEQKKYAERFGMYGSNIAAIKYFCWQEFQKPILKDRAFELEYASLRGHPLWKEERADYTPRQWAQEAA